MPSCGKTGGVKALRGTDSIDNNHWTGRGKERRTSTPATQHKHIIEHVRTDLFQPTIYSGTNEQTDN